MHRHHALVLLAVLIPTLAITQSSAEGITPEKKSQAKPRPEEGVVRLGTGEIGVARVPGQSVTSKPATPEGVARLSRVVTPQTAAPKAPAKPTAEVPREKLPEIRKAADNQPQPSKATTQKTTTQTVPLIRSGRPRARFIPGVRPSKNGRERHVSMRRGVIARVPRQPAVNPKVQSQGSTPKKTLATKPQTQAGTDKNKSAVRIASKPRHTPTGSRRIASPKNTPVGSQPVKKSTKIQPTKQTPKVASLKDESTAAAKSAVVPTASKESVPKKRDVVSTAAAKPKSKVAAVTTTTATKATDNKTKTQATASKQPASKTKSEAIGVATTGKAAPASKTGASNVTGPSLSISTPNKVFRPERHWLGFRNPNPERPVYMKDLEALLDRKKKVAAAPVRSVSRTQTTADDCDYSDIDAIFNPLSKVAAFQPAQSDLQEPADCAGSLMAGAAVPVQYNAQVLGGPPAPSRHVHAFHHNPLYFEDMNLERCGRSHYCATTAVSAARFFGSTVILPYLMTLDHPSDCVEASPDCPTCWEFPPEATKPRWSLKAAAVQAGAITGAFFIIP